MRRVTLTTLTTLIAVLAAIASPGLAHAQAYPAKTVRIVVPWPPGRLVDAAGRIVFQNRISSEINKSMDSPDTKKRMETLEPWTMTSEQTAARFRTDYEKYGKLIKLVGMAPQ